MAYEIAVDGQVNVRREKDIDRLMAIRRREEEYGDLVAHSENLIVEIKAAFADSSLPDHPDRDAAERVLIEIREAVYGSTSTS